MLQRAIRCHYRSAVYARAQGECLRVDACLIIYATRRHYRHDMMLPLIRHATRIRLALLERMLSAALRRCAVDVDALLMLLRAMMRYTHARLMLSACCCLFTYGAFTRL